MTTVETSDLAITASTEVSAVYRQNQVNEPVLPVPVPLNRARMVSAGGAAGCAGAAGGAVTVTVVAAAAGAVTVTAAFGAALGAATPAGIAWIPWIAGAEVLASGVTAETSVEAVIARSEVSTVVIS